jgi:DNA end-binding protein Ku
LSRQSPRRQPSPEVIELPRRGSPPPVEEPEEEPPPEQVQPVRHAAIAENDQRPVPAADLVKGYEYQPERWVVLEREEIRRLAPKTSAVADITEFVRLAGIDPVFFESSYYVAPERTGEKAYAILYTALKETGLAAVAELAMHGRNHVLIVRPGPLGLVAHTMYYLDEVRRDLEWRADPSLVSEKELELAKTLVKTLESGFEPEKYRDRYREQLESLIASKLQGREVAEQPAAKQAGAPVVDILEALQKSLAAVRKPPAEEKAQTPKKKTHRRASR